MPRWYSIPKWMCVAILLTCLVRVSPKWWRLSHCSSADYNAIKTFFVAESWRHEDIMEAKAAVVAHGSLTATARQLILVLKSSSSFLRLLASELCFSRFQKIWLLAQRSQRGNFHFCAVTRWQDGARHYRRQLRGWRCSNLLLVFRNSKLNEKKNSQLPAPTLKTPPGCCSTTSFWQI